MKNEKKPITNRQRRFLKILVPIALIVIMGINCFASPTDNNNSYRPVSYIGDMGQFYATFSDYYSYDGISFALGVLGKGDLYNFGHITATSVDLNEGYPSSSVNYETSYSSSNIDTNIYIYSPILWYSGPTASKASFQFSVGGNLACSFQYAEIDINGEFTGNYLTYSWNQPISSSNYYSAIPERADLPISSGVFVYDYVMTFTPNTPTTMTLKYRDTYNSVALSNLMNVSSGNQYLYGYNEGYNLGYTIGNDNGYTSGKADGFAEGRGLGYEEGVKDGNLDFNGVGGFIDIMLRGQRYYVLNNDGSLKLDSDGDPVVAYDGGIMSTPLFGESFPWITIGNVLGSFVAVSLATFIMKLFLGG